MPTYQFAGQYGPQQVTDKTGRPLPALSVTVNVHGSGVLAALYTDRTKGTGGPNPLQTDSLGNLVFFADPGLYDIIGNGGSETVAILPDPAEPQQGDVTGPAYATVLQDTPDLIATIHSAIQSLFTAAGQLIVGTGNGTAEELAKGSAGYVLQVGGADPSGLQWAPVSGLSVTSFNTRQGAVTLTAADVEGLFTAAGQILSGTGTGTGQLIDLLTALEAKFTGANQILLGSGVGTGSLVSLLTALEGLFTSANQVLLGTGSGTGALTDIGTAINNKFAAKGDIRIGTGSGTGAILGIGTDGTVLIADSTQTDGARWGIPGVKVVSTSFTSNAYTLALADANTAQQASNGATAATITIPTNASVAFPVGTVITVTQTGTGKIQIAAAGGVTVEWSGTFTSGTTGCNKEYSTIGLLKTATDTWVLSGDAA